MLLKLKHQIICIEKEKKSTCYKHVKNLQLSFNFDITPQPLFNTFDGVLDIFSVSYPICVIRSAKYIYTLRQKFSIIISSPEPKAHM